MKRSVVRLLTAVSALALGAILAPHAAAMPDPAPRSGQYVSLGDSFVAAGSIATSDSDGCSQAVDDVGHLVAARLPGVRFADWACSGAATGDVTTAGSMGPQIRGLGPRTEYVSLSIGGNDGNLFADLIQDCLVGAFCTPEVEKDAMAKIDILGPRLDATYAAVRKAAPNAQVVVVPYLRILPDDPRACFADVLMGDVAVQRANRVQMRLNKTITQRAERAGFTVVDPNTAPGHSMCAPDGARWVSLTGVGPGDDGVPIHPTLAGRKHVAKLVAAAFRDQR
ncbi:SGNH/GDSL hydrolase family protein [Gordonia sp. (in: high G+C Gram-positive bacteria)]|uniref:SGNH/GDSL hydrolase family protein n=1 Tax=Gordonia sp. (in: high G+C Gram-positive bacteria) TaxID=84139 RepID=UPI0035280EB6